MRGSYPKSISAAVTKSMRSNKASGTKPELTLSKLLRKRIRSNNLPGKPDFIYPRKKIAVFLHGCFWHRCPKCNLGLPKRNKSYWAEKFEANVQRDKRMKIELEKMGWRVVEIWEHELKNSSDVRKKIVGC